MLTHDLDEALGYLLQEEGGWSNNPSDTGGKTMWGVTQGVYDDYRSRLKQLPKQSVSKVTKAEARELYDIMYWRASACDRLPWPISYLVFDAAVNSGTNRAIRWMQAGLSLPQDSRVGQGTLAAAQQAVATGNGSAMLEIVAARAEFLARLVQRSPSQATFLVGWWKRTLRVLGRALLSEIN